MRTTVILLAVIVAVSSFAVDLHLLDGGVLVDARLERRDGDTVTIVHRSGAGTYRVSDFSATSEAWLRERSGTRDVGGISPVDDRKWDLAWEFMGLFCTNRSIRVDLGLKVHRTVLEERREQEPPPSLANELHRIRNTILARFYASEFEERELQELIEIYRRPVMQKHHRLQAAFGPEVDGLVDLYFREHPEKIADMQTRLSGKSRNTGAYYVELERLIDEVKQPLKDALTTILRKHFTVAELAEMDEMENRQVTRRLRRLSLKEDLILPQLAEHYLREKPDDLALILKWMRQCRTERTGPSNSVEDIGAKRTESAR